MFVRKINRKNDNCDPYPPSKNTSNQDSVTGGQYTKVHHRTLNNGDEELAELSDPMSRGELVLGGGVVDGQ